MFTEHENHQTSDLNIKCVLCVCVFFLFILDVKFVGSTSRGRTGFLIHLPSAVRAFVFVAKMMCTNDLIVLHFFSFFFFFSEEKSQLPGFELTSKRARRLRGYQLSYREKKGNKNRKRTLGGC